VAPVRGGMGLELDTWTVPDDSRPYDWGEGLLARAPDGRPSVFFRFYEWNLFGAVREGTATRADKSQAHVVNCDPKGRRGEITYPAHGVDLFADPGEESVALSLRVENRTGRDWPREAALIPCLNPGRTPEDTPVIPELADSQRANTYYCGADGLARLADGRIHWHADYREAVAAHRPDGGFPTDGSPWNEEGEEAVTEALLVRESDAGDWVTGIGWEAGLSVDAHNPWRCMHVSVPVGPLAPGETTEIGGRLYLQRGDRHDVLDSYREEFGDQ
jgi:hypothetical protein